MESISILFIIEQRGKFCGALQEVLLTGLYGMLKIERIIIRGNSNAARIEVEGARVIARRGARLGAMMDEAIRERDELTIFIYLEFLTCAIGEEVKFE